MPNANIESKESLHLVAHLLLIGCPAIGAVSHTLKTWNDLVR